MKIHLVSDVHVEIAPPNFSTVQADVYVCAGDIGLANDTKTLENYFKKLQDNTNHIIWVMGNHEFYRNDYSTALDQCWELANRIGVHLLDIEFGSENLELDGVKFWGSTFWTDLDKANPNVMNCVKNGMNDYRIISDGNGVPLTSQKTMDINTESRKKLNWDADVIITHHCPSMIRHRNFPLSDFTYGFCNTGLDEMIFDSDVKYWMYGHTHDSRSVNIGDTRIISNQQGYPRFNPYIGEYTYEDPNFDPTLLLQL